MAKRRPTRDPQPEQFVFPFELRVGDVILDEGTHSEVVTPPKAGPVGKTTRARVRREGEPVQQEIVWEAWRKVRVVRSAA